MTKRKFLSDQQIDNCPTTGGENRKIMFQHFMDMFASREVVEIALEQ